jgi:hypothetical protein
VEAERIRVAHGYCVGRSAGANLIAARRLSERFPPVLTVWPDCADRYGSVGLARAWSDDVRCPLKSACEARSRDRLHARRTR